MIYQEIILVSLASVCCAVSVDPYGNVLAGNKQQTRYKYGEYAYPKYEFEYAVSDPHSGDYKRHRESRDGENVRGEYSLLEPGGSLRRVQYTADDHTGFNAIVSKAVHKHGDYAFSFAGHARHFLPTGGGQKYGKLFPTATAHGTNQPQKQSDSVEFRVLNPAQNPIIMKVVAAEKSIAPVATDEENISSSVSPSNSKSQEMTFMKSEVTPDEATNESIALVPDQKPILNMQEVMAFIMANQVKQQLIPDVKVPMMDNMQPNVLNDDMTTVPAGKVLAGLELNTEKKGDTISTPTADSAAASSYYRTQVYYLG